MAVSSQYIQELVARNDIYEVVSQYVELKRSGRLYKGLCPFHSEKTPSFTVYPETQSYYCFGCQKGGDVVRFIMEVNSMTRMEAIAFLAQRCGMPLPDEDDGVAKLKSRIYSMNRRAARYFFSVLKSPRGRPALSYLRERGLSDRTIIKFGLGYCDDSWKGLVDHLRSLGYSDDEMTTGYLARKNKNGNLYDIFHGRVIFPIIDTRDNVIAFGGRRIDDSGGPKYLNSGDTPVFKKSNGLFALNFAKKSGSGTFILAEGYMDVIALHQRGFSSAVATLGTALTERQAKLIGDYAEKVVLSYDSDAAGQNATRRALGIFSKEDISVNVLKMEGAKDPDEYIKKYGRQRFGVLLEKASPAVDFNLSGLKEGYDLSDTQQRLSYLTKACETVAGLKSPIRQDMYCSKLADETGVDKDSIKLQVQRARARSKKMLQSRKERELLNGTVRSIKVDYRQKGSTMSTVFAGQQIIYGIIMDPSLLKTAFENLEDDDFTDSDTRRAFREIKRLAGENLVIDYPTVCRGIPRESASVLAGVFARNEGIAITEKDLLRHIDKLKNPRLSPGRAGEKSVEEIARRLRTLKDKRK